MKKYFYVLISLMAVIFTLANSFSIWKKHNHDKERKERLDRYYSKELNSTYFALLNAEARNGQVSSAYDRIERTEDHMSKDGYDWQQIEEIKKRAETEQNERMWKTDWGHNDGLSNKDPDPNYLDDPYYMYAFDKAKKTKAKPQQ